MAGKRATENGSGEVQLLVGREYRFAEKNALVVFIDGEKYNPSLEQGGRMPFSSGVLQKIAAKNNGKGDMVCVLCFVGRSTKDPESGRFCFSVDTRDLKNLSMVPTD